MITTTCYKTRIR